MNFSDKIKFQREQNHLTQKELAELVGVSQRAIAAYESSGTIARISTMRKLAHALNVSYDYLKHDEITDPSYGIEKMDYIDEINGQLGEKGARDINEILEANRALFAGGELDEEAKDAFYQAVTKAYLSCKMEAKKTFGRKKKTLKRKVIHRCPYFRTALLLLYTCSKLSYEISRCFYEFKMYKRHC